jgi:LysM repeat protein
MAAGAAAVAVLGGVAAATTAGFGLLDTPSDAPSASPLAARTSSPSPTPLATPVATATPVPTRSPTAIPSPRPATPAPTPAPTARTYVVQEGDTLNGIAARFGVSIAALREANGLSGDLITIGQRLIIP